MSVINESLQANQQYATEFAKTNKGSLPLPPGRKTTYVVCMDARIDPAKALGLQEGDAHVIRNAGGRFKDAERSVIISQTLLGTQEVAFIHHTDCGMLTFTDHSIRDKLKKEKNSNADHIAFLPFGDLEQSVRDDLKLYNESPYVRHDIPVRGFIYDVKSGKLQEVQSGKN